MTKVQTHFRLERALNDEHLTRIREVQAIYGIERVVLYTANDSMMVEFDASRLRMADIESMLRQRGLPIEPVAA